MRFLVKLSLLSRSFSFRVLRALSGSNNVRLFLSNDLLVLCGLLWFLNISFENQHSPIISHKVDVQHPGISLTEPVERILYEIKNEKGQSKAFYMNVETVVCGDTQCRIDTVQIFWDAFGFYDRLVLPSEVELEKAEGKHFDQADYEKLDNILSNKNCSLKEVYKEEVVGSETTEGVDAYSGATIILNTNDYVQGAVWTCYTLWHWVNGDAFSIIRNISGEHLSTNDWIDVLNNEKTATQIFALEQVIRKKNYQPEIIAAIQKNAPSNNYQLTKLTIKYFENSPDEIYFKTMEEFLKTDNPEQRLLYLTSILKNKNHPPKDFYKSLTTHLPTWNDYPSINLFLNLLDNKNASSPDVTQSLITLLNHENFIIARRAYWFLESKKLSLIQQSQLEKFRIDNQERL